MTNPISKAYEKLDDAIMYGVNKGVRAWNWSTGRTKSDLANLLENSGLVVMTVGNVNCLGPLLAVPLSAYAFYLGLKGGEVYKKVDSLES